MPITTRLLEPSDKVSEFSCGKTALDIWLHRSAMKTQRSGTARTWVWADINSSVVAYFSLAPHKVVRDSIAKSVGRGSPDEIPAILLAKLALDLSLQGKGMGGALLADSLVIAVNAMRDVGGRLIVVDAIDDDAASFYAAHGFISTPNEAHRLVMKASSAAKSLGINWP